MPTSLTNEYRPIQLPNYVEVPVDEMRRRAKAFYDVMRKRHKCVIFHRSRFPAISLNNVFSLQGQHRAAPIISPGISAFSVTLR